MKTAVIRQRVADFLKRHAPFDVLDEGSLLGLAGSGRVKFHESDEYVFRQGDLPGQFLFVIQQGRVELLDETPGGERLRDVLGEGDLLGLDRLIGEGRQRHSARTAGDVILYALDGATFTSLVESQPAVRRYVTAHVSATGAAGVERSSWLDLPAPPESFLPEGEPGPGELPLLAENWGTREAVRAMIGSGNAAVCTPSGRVLRAEDLALFCGHHPAALRERIRCARNAQELGPLLGCARRSVVDALGNPGDVDDGALLGSAFVRAGLEAAARIAAGEIAAAGIDVPASTCCWIAFGPAARGELLRPALPNLAVVYDDQSAAEAGLWYAALAGQTIACLHECGLEGPGLSWPEGAQPSMPLAEWKRFYGETMRNPIGAGLYERRDFFDLCFLAGDFSLFEDLSRHFAAELASHPNTIGLLANDTLSHLPPLTLFRGLVLQLDGAQADQLDLRKTVLQPVADAARVFGLNCGGRSGTLERLEQAGDGAVFGEAAGAFRAGLYFEAVSGESRIDPARLGRYDQRLLKTAFSAVQSLLEQTIATFDL